MKNIWSMEWKNFSMESNRMEDFERYRIWKISIPFHGMVVTQLKKKKKKF